MYHPKGHSNVDLGTVCIKRLSHVDILLVLEPVYISICDHNWHISSWLNWNTYLGYCNFISYQYIYLDRPFISEHVYIWGAYDKFPDIFRMGTFIDSTHRKLVPFEVISTGCNALVVPFQQLLEGPMEVLLCKRVNDLCHSLFHLLNCLIMTASELRE